MRSNLTAQCAQLAARMLVEGAAHGFEHAKRKAAERLKLSDARQFPDHLALFHALIEYQRLFDLASTKSRTEKMRRAALSAIRFFDRFLPHLVGPALHGTPLYDSPISFHLFADDTDAIARFLIDQRRPYRFSEVSLRINARATERHPCYEICHDAFDYRLLAMPLHRLRQPPLSQLDGKPVQRLNYTQLEALLAEDPTGLYRCPPPLASG
jgi:hypothetical protein